MGSLRRMRRTARTVLDAAVMRPPFARTGHYYSPLTNSADVERALSWSADIPGVDLREEQQVELFRELVPLLDGVPDCRYQPGNGWYDSGDACLYQAITRWLKPNRVVEVGSGFSTAKLLDTADAFLPDLNVTCIEPNPDRLLGLLQPSDSVEVIAAPVQAVPLATFTSLQSGDILFIDSTHVAKAGSDVVWLFLHVLPRLASGVVVHVHDVFWPFEYPSEWLHEGRDWNEGYLLNAFLCNNDAWRIELFSSWLWRNHPEMVPDDLRKQNPGSIWLRRL